MASVGVWCGLPTAREKEIPIRSPPGPRQSRSEGTNPGAPKLPMSQDVVARCLMRDFPNLVNPEDLVINDPFHEVEDPPPQDQLTHKRPGGGNRVLGIGGTPQL